MSDSPAQIAYTVNDTAVALAISERQVWILIKEKKLPAIKLSARCVRILKTDLEQFLSTLRS